MLEIAKPEIATYFIARNADGSVLHTGEVTPDLVVTTGQPVLEYETTENAALQKLSAYPDKFPPLPAQGESVEANQLYSYQGGVVKARQSHTRTEHTDLSLIPALFSVYQVGGGTLDWVANEQVSLGTLRIYQGQTYRCIQAHTTQSDWQPPNVPALWETYTPPVTGATWVDSGATFQGVIGAGVCNVSNTAPFQAGQQIRIGSVETSVTSIWTAGAPGVLQFPVGDTTALQAVANGTAIEIWQ